MSTMSVLLDGAALSAVFGTASALSFLTFTLLYTPCVAAVAAIRREMGSILKTVGIVMIQCMTAWLCGVLVYRIALLFIA